MGTSTNNILTFTEEDMEQVAEVMVEDMEATEVTETAILTEATVVTEIMALDTILEMEMATVILAAMEEVTEVESAMVSALTMASVTVPMVVLPGRVICTPVNIFIEMSLVKR